MTTTQLLGGVQSIESSTQGVVDVLGRLSSGSYWSQLKPASYRGVPFIVSSASAQFGRRNAVHEYPFRDTPWVEDIGRQRRAFQVSGFVVGDDVIAQRDSMIAAAEKKGDGELVHPTLGRRTVALITFSCSEARDHGRVFEYTFTFIEQGQRLYPSAATSGLDAVAAASSSSVLSTALAWVREGASILQQQASVVNTAIQTAAGWVSQAQEVANDATSLLKLGVSLPGQFGRLLGLASGVSVGEVVAVSAGLTLFELTGIASQARQAVAAAGEQVLAAAGEMTATNTQPFADAVQVAATAVLSVSSTPGDALRSLARLAAYQPPAAIGTNQQAMQAAVLDLLRRTAACAIAIAGSKYQPRSADDAASVRAQVLALLDDEITIAGDEEDDAVYASMRALRVQCVADLNARGAALPTLVTVTFGASMPSLVIAQRLYRDVARADELVARAGVVHPAFMPVSFQALNQ